MPELPEVETVRRGLESVLVDARFSHVEQRRPDLRFPFPEGFAARLTGQKITSLGRRAKYLLGTLESGEVLIMHLGMSGRFIISRPGANAQRPGEFLHDKGKASRHDHVVFTMSNGATVTYNDVRRFGFMTLADGNKLGAHKFMRNLGVEPLSDDLSPGLLAARCKGKKTSLKAALLIGFHDRLIAFHDRFEFGERRGHLTAGRAGSLTEPANTGPMALYLRFARDCNDCQSLRFQAAFTQSQKRMAALLRKVSEQRAGPQ